MVSVCLPSDALLQHLLSYLGFSYLGHGVSLHGCSSKAQPLLLTLDEGYLLTSALPDLQRGIAPLGPPAPAQPRLLGRGVGPPGHQWHIIVVLFILIIPQRHVQHVFILLISHLYILFGVTFIQIFFPFLIELFIFTVEF